MNRRVVQCPQCRGQSGIRVLVQCWGGVRGYSKGGRVLVNTERLNICDAASGSHWLKCPCGHTWEVHRAVKLM